MGDDNALKWVHDVQTLTRSGTEFTSAANEIELQALASRLEVPSVQLCEVHWTIKPWRKSGVRILGRLHAKLTQSCRVTLEPVDAEINEQIDVRLTDDARMVEGQQNGPDAVDFDPEERDPAELFDGNKIELGEIASEHLALGLDPYPRAANASFEGFEVAEVPGENPSDKDEEAGSPFSALAQLANGSSTRQKN